MGISCKFFVDEDLLLLTSDDDFMVMWWCLLISDGLQWLIEKLI